LADVKDLPSDLTFEIKRNGGVPEIVVSGAGCEKIMRREPWKNFSLKK